MEELTLEGKHYISSKRAAKLSGYTKDYIGQLCRAGVLPAKMVGRVWYIERGALEEHKKTYRGESLVESGVWDVNRVEEESKTLREIAAQYVGEQEERHREELLGELFDIKYERDTGPLYPAPERKHIGNVSKTAGAERIGGVSSQADRSRDIEQERYYSEPKQGKDERYRSGMSPSQDAKMFSIRKQGGKQAPRRMHGGLRRIAVPPSRQSLQVGVLRTGAVFIALIFLSAAGSLLLGGVSVYERHNGVYVLGHSGIVILYVGEGGHATSSVPLQASISDLD